MTDRSSTNEAYQEAVRKRNSGENIEAGEWYTSAAYAWASSMPLYPSSGVELKHFLEAATCYRIGGDMERCRNRCKTGILRAEDMSVRALSGPMPEHDIHHADRGGWQEAIGLFCLVGEIDGADEAYDRAFEVYEAAGDPRSDRSETPTDTIYNWVSALRSAATGESLTNSFMRERTYTECAEYFRRKVPEYLDTLEQDGEWVT